MTADMSKAHYDISIHALRGEGDVIFITIFYIILYFNPRPPRGGRLKSTARKFESVYFNPRPPRGGRPRWHGYTGAQGAISIHALRGEGDLLNPGMSFSYFLFQSTPSAGRATVCFDGCRLASKFQSTPSAGRATHDKCPPSFPILFQSTPSAGRATRKNKRVAAM